MNVSRTCINLCVHCVKQMSTSQLDTVKNLGLARPPLVERFITIIFILFFDVVILAIFATV